MTMTDTPERIWACMGGPMVGMFVSGGNNGGWPEYVRADIVQALTAERNKAVLGNHRFNEHEPTWAELTDFWKARAENAEADNARLGGLIDDVVCGRGMFGLSTDDDLKWALQHLGSALNTGKADT